MPLALVQVDGLFTLGLLLLATFIGVAWLTRRLRGGGAGSRRQSVVLTGQHALHVVELDGERLLIGTGPSGSPRLLARMPKLESPAEASGPQGIGGPSGLQGWLGELARARLGGGRGR